MNRLLLVLVGAAIGALVVFNLPGDSDAEAVTDIRAAYARALAFYRNETNANDRRSRMELAPFGARRLKYFTCSGS